MCQHPHGRRDLGGLMRWEPFPQESSCTDQVRSHQELLLLPLYSSVPWKLKPQQAANEDVLSDPAAQSLPPGHLDGQCLVPLMQGGCLARPSSHRLRRERSPITSLKTNLSPRLRHHILFTSHPARQKIPGTPKCSTLAPTPTIFSCTRVLEAQNFPAPNQSALS